MLSLFWIINETFSLNTSYEYERLGTYRARKFHNKNCVVENLSFKKGF